MSDDLSIPNPGYRGNRAGRYGTGQGRVGQRMDPDTRRLVMFAGGLGAVLVTLIGASALIGHRSTQVPVITADIRPIRVKPDNPGGMKIDGAENDVFSSGSDTANSRLAAPSENPDTKALHTEAAPPSPLVENPAAAASAPIGVAPLAPAKPPVVMLPPPAAKPAIVANAPPAAKPVVGANPPAAEKPAIAANAPPVAKAAAAPAAKPIGAKPSVAAVEAHPPVPGRRATVQLAALASEEAARNEWQQLSKRMPDLLNGHQPVFSRTDRNGRVFWRLRTSGFADEAQARAFCERVRVKGGGCSVAEF